MHSPSIWYTHKSPIRKLKVATKQQCHDYFSPINRCMLWVQFCVYALVTRGQRDSSKMNGWYNEVAADGRSCDNAKHFIARTQSTWKICLVLAINYWIALFAFSTIHTSTIKVGRKMQPYKYISKKNSSNGNLKKKKHRGLDLSSMGETVPEKKVCAHKHK